MKSLFKKNSVLLNWCISYIIVLSIPLIAIASNYINTNKVIAEEVSKLNYMVFDQIYTDIENELTSLQDCANSILFDEILKNVLYSENQAEFVMNSKKLVDSLANRVAFAQNTDILIYLDQKEHIITKSTANTTAYLYQSVNPMSSQVSNSEEWRELLRNTTYGFYSTDYLSYQHFVSPHFSFVTEFPLNKKAIYSQA